MNEDTQKLIENTIKDVLLGNTAVTFIFALPLSFIAKHGFSVAVWAITLFVAPILYFIGTWIVTRIQFHASAFFISKWARRGFVIYVLISTEFLVIYSIAQVIKTLIK